MARDLLPGSSRSSWGVVLAGGQGVRLRRLVSDVCGEPRPKQFVALTSTRTLLRQTLDRVALAIPAERTVVVTLREQVQLVERDVRPGDAVAVLAQPQARGTAPAILYAAHWIHWRDPEATLAVFPSDHFVGEEHVFMRHVCGLASVVARNQGLLLLLGAEPNGPDGDYGWIVPGEPLEHAHAPSVRRVRRFLEKPQPSEASACRAAGGLWNTFVFVAKAAFVLDVVRRRLPELSAVLAAVARYTDAADSWALRRAYAAAPEVDFSRDVLQSAPACLGVSRLSGVAWSDLGTPERVRAVRRPAAPADRGRPIQFG